jgi:HEAT repeat protein
MGKESAPGVTELLIDRQPVVRKAAAESLQSLLADVDPDRAAPWLVAMLDYRGKLLGGKLVEKERGYELDFIAKYVNPYLTPPAAPEHQIDESVYELAEELLVKLDRLGEAPPIHLVHYLFDSDLEKVRQAANGFAGFGKKDDPNWRNSSDWIRIWLQDETRSLNRLEIQNTPERIRKKQALREPMYTALGEKIVPKLSGLLVFGAPPKFSARAYDEAKDRTWYLRAEAARALGKIGSDAASAIPALEIVIKDDTHPEVIREATAARDRIRAQLQSGE